MLLFEYIYGIKDKYKRKDGKNMRDKIVNFLARCAGKMRLYEMCTCIGLEGLTYRIFYRDEIAESKHFFRSKAKRIKRICDHLADYESVLIYKNAIRYRIDRYRHNHPKWDADSQYFPKDIVTLSNKEVFVDCGAYTGDTMEKFLSIVDRKNWRGKYIGFEPNKDNYQKLVRGGVKRNDSRFKFYKYGVWKYSGTLKFYDNGMSVAVGVKNNFMKVDGKISCVDVKALDDVEDCRDATFIKMDIEGSEMGALKGAEKIIRSNMPKLAICIYHSDKDMIRIAEWIIGLGLEYKLYIRHHSLYSNETVLYAVPY